MDNETEKTLTVTKNNFENTPQFISCAFLAFLLQKSQSTEATKSNKDDTFIIDIRPSHQFHQSHILGAHSFHPHLNLLHRRLQKKILQNSSPNIKSSSPSQPIKSSDDKSIHQATHISFLPTHSSINPSQPTSPIHHTDHIDPSAHHNPLINSIPSHNISAHPKPHPIKNNFTFTSTQDDILRGHHENVVLYGSDIDFDNYNGNDKIAHENGMPTNNIKIILQSLKNFLPQQQHPNIKILQGGLETFSTLYPHHISTPSSFIIPSSLLSLPSLSSSPLKYHTDRNTMKNDSCPSEVLPWLLLGTHKHTSQSSLLSSLHITALINVTPVPLLDDDDGENNYKHDNDQHSDNYDDDFSQNDINNAKNRNHNINNFFGLFKNEEKIQTTNGFSLDLLQPIKSRYVIKTPPTDQSLKITLSGRPMRYLQLKVNDGQEDDIQQHFEAAISFIDGVRKEGGKVMVHCLAGVSRSATVVMAYLMHHLRLDVDTAYDFLKAKRSFISPNLNFMRQLDLYHRFLCLSKDRDSVNEGLECSNGEDGGDDKNVVYGGVANDMWLSVAGGRGESSSCGLDDVTKDGSVLWETSFLDHRVLSDKNNSDDDLRRFFPCCRYFNRYLLIISSILFAPPQSFFSSTSSSSSLASSPSISSPSSSSSSTSLSFSPQVVHISFYRKLLYFLYKLLYFSVKNNYIRPTLVKNLPNNAAKINFIKIESYIKEVVGDLYRKKSVFLDKYVNHISLFDVTQRKRKLDKTCEVNEKKVKRCDGICGVEKKLLSDSKDYVGCCEIIACHCNNLQHKSVAVELKDNNLLDNKVSKKSSLNSIDTLKGTNSSIEISSANNMRMKNLPSIDFVAINNTVNINKSNAITSNNNKVTLSSFSSLLIKSPDHLTFTFDFSPNNLSFKPLYSPG